MESQKGKGRSVTLYTSEDKRPQKRDGRTNTLFFYLGIGAGAILLETVYARFSHGVASAAMNLLFLYPMLGGILFFFAAKEQSGQHPSLARASVLCYHSGIATLGTGSLLQGILEIAGTESTATPYFYLVGAAFTFVGLFGLFARRRPSK